MLALVTFFILLSAPFSVVAAAFFSLDAFSVDLLDLSRRWDSWAPLLLCHITTKHVNTQSKHKFGLERSYQHVSVLRAGPVTASENSYLQGIFLSLFSLFLGRGSPLLPCRYLGAPQLFLALCGLRGLRGLEGLVALSHHIRSRTLQGKRGPRLVSLYLFLLYNIYILNRKELRQETKKG